METCYQNMETIYTSLTAQLELFHNQLNILKNEIDNSKKKNVTIIKKESKTPFTMVSAESYLRNTDVKLSQYGYSPLHNPNEKYRHERLMECIKNYDKESVVEKLSALICIWTSKVNNDNGPLKNNLRMLNNLQFDYATIKNLP